MPDRTIVIGDIHGCADALHALLEAIQPEASDTIITLGDYVDRGPHSAQVLDTLTDLISDCHLIPLLGNHEIMMTQALNNRRDFEFWVFNGGKTTLESYGGDINNLPMHHRTFLNHCQRFHETDTHIFVHAAYNHELAMAQQPDDLLFWQHVGDGFIPDPHVSGKTVICGHTPQLNGEVCDLGHIIILDTFCYGDQWLTAMNVETGEILQANLAGRLRQPASNLNKRKSQASSPTATAASDQLPGQLDSSQQNDSLEPVDWPFDADRTSPLNVDGPSFLETLNQVGGYIANHLDHLDDYPVKNNQAGESVAAAIDETLPEHGTELDPLLKDLFHDYIPGTFNTTSPGYLAYIPGGGIPEAAIADLIASTTNRFVTVWNASPALAQIESIVIRWLCRIMGYGDQAGGFLATGGSMANLAALIVARVKLAGDDFQRSRIYCSDQTHHCVDKAAFMAGFPKANLRKIPVDRQFQIDLEALRRAIRADQSSGFQPLVIVANAGTTNTGAIDDLLQLRSIADSSGCWLHADAAYGGFFNLTERGRDILTGIEQADSIVLDPHKGMFVPYGTGCLLVKRREDLLPAFQFTSDYMPAMTGDRQREDFCEISPELSRDNRSLRIWLPIKLHGIGLWRTLLEEKLRLAQWAHQQLCRLQTEIAEKSQRFELEIVAPPRLTVVAFCLNRRDADDVQNNELNRRWLDEINRGGRIMMTGTTIDGRFILRICVLSFRTHIDRMREGLCRVVSTARELTGID